MRNQKGFTLIEVIVVAGIIAILAGILVPLIFKQINESRIARANADIKSLSSAILVLYKDTGKWPVVEVVNCTNSLSLLRGDGSIPSNAVAKGFDQTGELSYDDPLSMNTGNCYPNWKGPYLARVTADPWGYAYLTNAKEFSVANAPVWIISAGPDGQLQTNATDATVSGDDIGLRLQ